MTRRIAIVAAIAGMLGIGGYAALATHGERADCPGKIICPLTGEPVCKDRCPVNKATDKDEIPACCKNKGA